MSLLQFFEKVYRTHRHDLSDSAAHQYRVTIRLLARYLGRAAYPRDLSPETLARFLRWLKDNGRSAATINRKRSSLMSVWRLAAKKGYCEFPREADDLPPPAREPKRLPNSWSLIELEKIIAHCEQLDGDLPNSGIPRHLWWSSLIRFLYESGARIGAVLAVTWDDVDTTNRMVVLRPESSKTDTEQLVVLTEHTTALLEQLRPFGHRKVWPWGKHHNELFRALKRILRATNLPCDRRSMFHRFRRTTATLLAAHSSLQAAQRALGHTSEAMTLKYVDPRAMPILHASQILPRPRVG